MYGFLLALLVLDGILLSVVVLLQSGKGGGLAAMGGGAAATEGILGGRQAATVLTRATWTTGSIFMVLSLILAILSSRAQAPTSILNTGAPAPATVPARAPGDGGILPGTTPPAGTPPATPDAGAPTGGTGTAPDGAGGTGAPPSP